MQVCVCVRVNFGHLCACVRHVFESLVYSLLTTIKCYVKERERENGSESEICYRCISPAIDKSICNESYEEHDVDLRDLRVTSRAATYIAAID